VKKSIVLIILNLVLHSNSYAQQFELCGSKAFFAAMEKLKTVDKNVGHIFSASQELISLAGAQNGRSTNEVWKITFQYLRSGTDVTQSSEAQVTIGIDGFSDWNGSTGEETCSVRFFLQ
jgi:hypothetical protein